MDKFLIGLGIVFCSPFALFIAWLVYALNLVFVKVFTTGLTVDVDNNWLAWAILVDFVLGVLCFVWAESIINLPKYPSYEEIQAAMKERVSPETHKLVDKVLNKMEKENER